LILILLGIFLLILLASAIKVVREYQRIVIFRLGRLFGMKGPGLVIVIPLIDRKVLVDLRTLAVDVPRQRVVTRDNVSVEVDAVVYYRVDDPIQAVIKVQNFIMATNLLAQTTLRDVVGQVDLDDLLSRREELNRKIQALLDIATDPWGIKVSAVTIRDVNLPENMIRAIAKQAEAERERRSRVIMAEGEFQAAQKMRDAAELYETTPTALRLRELQTLAEIARERNMIVVTPASEQAVGLVTGLSKASAKKAAGD
jgi:regulator of protease activity HflC (stomatin/prohibitin superfamily)